jgi:RNA polymerase nonessential primary-like sigma factor
MFILILVPRLRNFIFLSQEKKQSFLQLQKYDLLTTNKEILLSRQYKIALQIRDLKKGTVNNLGKEVSNKELARVLGLASLLLVRRGLDSRKQLVEANIGLVNYICNCYRYQGVPYPDLVQEYTLGLIKAVHKYDPERGCRFSTFTFWWIRQSVSRAIAGLFRFPCHIHQLIVSLGRSKKTFRILEQSRTVPPGTSRVSTITFKHGKISPSSFS